MSLSSRTKEMKSRSLSSRKAQKDEINVAEQSQSATTDFRIFMFVIGDIAEYIDDL